MVQNLAIGSYLPKNQEQAFNKFEFEHKKKQKWYNFVYLFLFNWKQGLGF